MERMHCKERKLIEKGKVSRTSLRKLFSIGQINGFLKEKDFFSWGTDLFTGPDPCD
jgi:hypothetical protein